jgi:hypothetical protein
VGEPDPDGDLSPWLADLDAYTREYTREDLAGLAADGLAYYDPARAVWVVQGGPTGSFEISDAEVLETSADGHLPDAYDARFDGYTRETLDDWVRLGTAVYDPERGVWTIYGEHSTWEVRDVDAPVQALMAGPDAGPPPLEALIDHATARYDAGLPPVNDLEGIVFNALRAADAGAYDGTTQWRADLLRLLEERGVQAWYEITYADGLGNALRPVRVWDEQSARQVALRMSFTGEQADVTLVASDGSRSVIGSYLDQQLLPGPGNPVDSPVPGGELVAFDSPVPDGELTAIAGGGPWPEPPPWPANPPPAAVSVAGRPLPVPAGDPRATPLQFPQGIFPLDVTATAGGGLRPARLLHPDGTPLDFRPVGDNQPVPAVAAGIVPGTGDLAPGWLQVIQRENGNLEAVHPALVSPRGVNPLAWLPYAQVQRFGEFDGAEAAGRDSALLPAMFVEQGDSIRTGAGEIREVTAVRRLPHADGVTVTIATTGPGGHASPLEYEGRQTVEVLIPAHHPAEDSPHAGHMFGMLRPPPAARAGDGQATRAELTDLGATLDWIGRDGTAQGPPPSFGRDGVPSSPGSGSAAISMADALQPGGGGAIPEQAGWQVALRWTATMHRVQSAAAAAIGGLAQDPAWLQLRALTTRARRLAADASAGRLRFSDPAWALRSWRAVWARVCEMTCDLTAGMMKDWLRGPIGRRKGSRPWQAARALHHAAAEGAAHAHRWLPRDVRLPAGSYEIPGPDGRTATARAKAMAAARRHAVGFPGPGSQLEFPGAVADVSGRAAPGRPGRHRGAPASGRQARAARPRPPRAG